VTGRLHLERLADIDDKVGRLGRAERETLRELAHRVEALHASFARQDRALSDVFERARLFDEQAVDDRRFARRVERMLRHDRPVIVGPWTGEVGFELLYWAPFVRWVVRRYGIDPGRLVIVSRGGVASWYGLAVQRYADLFSFFSPQEFREATEDAKKQRRVGEFDARVVARVREAHGLHGAELLHPGMMYRLFTPVWKELATLGRVEAYTEYARLTPPEHAVVADLPADYVAVRFYFSDCFPDTQVNRAFVHSTVEALGSHLPVVLLETPFAVDDHRDAAAGGGRVISLRDHLQPECNLAVQTAVVARARGFVGTYGGYSYLAPFHGVSALAFYSERTFKAHHLHLAQRVFARLGGATVVPLDAADLPLVRLATGGAPAAAS
jgi:hypothetical protein